MRRGRLSAAIFFLVASMSPRVAPGCRRLPQVEAVGGGVAWVTDGNRSHLFSSRDGRLLRTLTTDLWIMDVHFDPKRSEFWGSFWGEPPRLWSWSEAQGLRTVPVRARRIYATFQSEDGRRLVAATLSTAASPEEIDRAFVALGFWEGDRVRFANLAPPPDREDLDGPLPVGNDALFGYLVDTTRAVPVFPSIDRAPHGLVWLVRVPGSGRWLSAQQGTLRLAVSDDGAKTWTSTGELPAPPPGQQFAVAGLQADPYRRHIYALVAGGCASPAWLAKSTDGGQTWARIDGVPAVFPLFDAEGVWLPHTDFEADADGGSIVLALIRPEGGTARRMTLRLPAPERVRQEDDAMAPETP
jgi:hypothetical protein